MAFFASAAGSGQFLRRAASLLWSTARSQSSRSTSSQQQLLPKTSLSEPPWPEIRLPDPIEEAKHHKEVVQKVNELIATGQYGRLFAVVHFASRQWKVTSEDLILTENHVQAECGDRIRMEKVLLVGADNFTLLGKPLLGLEGGRKESWWTFHLLVMWGKKEGMNSLGFYRAQSFWHRLDESAILGPLT
ncbi:39S ribosomal protein L21, mitochondrial isoform X2 [Sceloporus undulatus]|uniref:39S ribosomal protein L21, mitochondrial isoform X2 n=1 Tax=Sceloporus undulatus TaxID=8520 RepID=UPI001C4D9854|nr:39S ribosomal protein L21, mitochondrial isoform X2 [Sceloporus undulatus]